MPIITCKSNTYNTSKKTIMKNTYIVNAYRWGKSENHSYTVGVFDNPKDAIECADSHTAYRGGKYVCVVEECIINEFDNDADNYTIEIYRTNQKKL